MNVGMYRFLFALSIAVAGALALLFLKNLSVQRAARGRLRRIAGDRALRDSVDAVFKDNEAFFNQHR